MGSKQSGNRRPKRREDPNNLSRRITIVLNPRKEEHRWALSLLDAFDAEQQQLPLNERRYRGDLMVEALVVHAGYERQEPTVQASAQDVIAIRDIVQYIMDKIESGGLPGGGGKRRKKEAPAVISGSMQATIDRYIAGGLSGDADVDED